MHQRRTGQDVLIDDILHYRNGRQFPKSKQDVGHLLLQPIGRKIKGCFPSPLASALSRRLAQTHNTTRSNQLPQIFRLQLQRTTFREWEWQWMHFSFSPRGEDWNDWRLTSQWAPSPRAWLWVNCGKCISANQFCPGTTRVDWYQPGRYLGAETSY